MPISYHATSEQKPVRDVRPLVYGALDLVFAGLYVVIATVVARSATGQFTIGSFALGGAAVLAALGTFVRRPAGWWLAVAGCGLVLTGAVTLIALLAVSAAFLHGVYGSMGKAASAVTLAIAAVAVEIYVLLPAFQLKYLLSRAGRQAYSR
jgi:hypothetical protein